MPAVEIEIGTKKRYFKIKEGLLREKCDPETPGAVVRTWDKPQPGSATELTERAWKGKIQGISIVEFPEREVLDIDLGDAVISMNTTERMFGDVAAKLPALDLDKEVEFIPYSFIPKDPKIGQDGNPIRLAGCTIKQDGVKITSYFFDIEKKKNLHGLPEYNKDIGDWKIHYTIERSWLAKFIKKEMVFGGEPKEEGMAQADDLTF